jgi:hypothetical protein
MIRALTKVMMSAVLAGSLLFSISSQAASSKSTFGVRANILPLLVGMTDLNVDLALGKFVLSANYLSWSLSLLDLEYAISGYGAELNYHISGGLTDSWYVGAGYKSLTINASDATTEGELATSGFSAQAGYSWVWSLLYMNLGAQMISYGDSDIVVKNKTTDAVVETKSSPVSGTGLYWSLGFAF